MTENVTNELLFETLKAIQGKLSTIGEDLLDVKRRITSLELATSQVHGDFAGQSIRIDRLEGRLSRIEQRLNLAD
jgi:hypothetical protein